MARRRKATGKVVPKRVRRKWTINPRTRVHAQEGYSRPRAKAVRRRTIEEET